MGMNQTLIHLGILLFSLHTVVSAGDVTSEFNASHRALRILSDGGLLSADEVPMVRRVLTAAALTYVAAALLHFTAIATQSFSSERNRDDNWTGLTYNGREDERLVDKMDLISYLKDQIEFLTEQFNQAESDKDVTMKYIVESRLDEAKKIKKAIDDGTISSLS